MFFRYGEQVGWTKPGIASAIHGPRVYQHENLPLGPSWADVQRLLASTESNRKADIRDRPILLLLAVYGLRASEVVGTRLFGYDSGLRRDRSGNEGPGARKVQYC
jgi:integrase/recombinase XerD